MQDKPTDLAGALIQAIQGNIEKESIIGNNGLISTQYATIVSISADKTIATIRFTDSPIDARYNIPNVQNYCTRTLNANDIVEVSYNNGDNGQMYNLKITAGGTAFR